MPVLQNSRHERFAQFLAQGKPAVEAYEQAGYRRDDGNAIRLAKKPAITGRVQELTGALARKSVVTAESLMQKAEEVRALAYENRQFGAAVAAIKEMGVLSGHRIERREVGSPAEFDAMTDDELKRALVERIKALRLWLMPEIVSGSDQL